MSAPAFSGPQTAGWRPYALALLPLALAGALPWWATALLCLLYGLGVRFAAWQQGRLLIGLLVVGLTIVAAFPALSGSPQAQALELIDNLQWQYLARLLMLGLLTWGTGKIEDGDRRGLWLVLLAGLLAPQPLLVAALAGGAAALPGLDDRRGSAARWFVGRADEQAQTHATRRLWLWPLLFVLGVTALSLGLPRFSPQVAPQTAPARRSTPDPARPTAPSPARTADAPQTSPQVIKPPAATSALKLPNAEVPVALAMLLAVLLLVFLLGRGGQKSQKPSLPELLMAAALLLTFGLLLIFGAVSRGGAGGGLPGAGPEASGSGQAAQAGAATTSPSPALVSLAWAVYWLLLLAEVGMIALLVWLLLRRFRPQPRPLAAAQSAPVASHTTPDQLALHRVRVAYQQASEALRGQGWGRGAAETPLAYAGRLGAQFPGLAGPLHTLTAAYDPVRYGGRVSEEDAELAEAAAQAVQTQAAQLPPPAEIWPPEASPTPQENP